MHVALALKGHLLCVAFIGPLSLKLCSPQDTKPAEWTLGLDHTQLWVSWGLGTWG